jgi:hypothetical protein
MVMVEDIANGPPFIPVPASNDPQMITFKAGLGRWA